MNFLYIINPDAPMALKQALLVSLTGLCVVLLELALLTIIIQVISRVVRAFSRKKADAPETVIAPPPAPQVPRDPVLTGVDEPTAAVIMAIVSDRSGIPLERLGFRSIKLMQEGEK